MYLFETFAEKKLHKTYPFLTQRCFWASSVSCLCHSFLFIDEYHSRCGWSAVCLSIHLLKDSWVISGWELLWIRQLWVSKNKHLQGHNIFISLGVSGIEWIAGSCGLVHVSFYKKILPCSSFPSNDPDLMGSPPSSYWRRKLGSLI